MRLNLLLAIVCLPLFCITQNAPLGTWVDQSSFREIRKVTSGDAIYCASQNGIFSYEPSSGVIDRLTKVHGLSNTNITSIEYLESNEVLAIGYSSGDLDILSESGIQRYSDIANANIIGDKGINNITPRGTELWLACGFGVVVFDLEREEISDSYFIGSSGQSLRVNDLAFREDRVFAATDQGILSASQASNLSDFNNWSLETMGFSNPVSPFLELQLAGSYLLAIVDSEEENGVYRSADSGWEFVGGSEINRIKSLSYNGDKVLYTYENFMQLRTADGGFVETVMQYPFDDWPTINQAVLNEDGSIYVADFEHSLVLIDGNEVESIRPSSPYIDSSWGLFADNGELWIVHGELKSNWDNVFNDKAFSGLKNGTWIRGDGDEIFQDVRDLVDVQGDISNPNIIHFASFLGGLLTYNKVTGNYVLQNDVVGNSNLTGSSLLPNRVQSSSLAYDIQGNLWVTNNYTEEPFKVKQRNGEWVALGCPGVISGSTLMGEMVITEAGQTWCVLPRGVGLVMLQHNNNLNNTNDHECRKFSTAVGNGALPTLTVYCVEEDLDGEIWVGTAEGPVVNYNPLGVFSSNPSDFQSILVERDGNVERLLGSESITAIAVDGANRKWLGTLTGGVYLLSPDGTEEIHHFTESNSPLFSNVIQDIAIDKSSGAVHIATDKGTLTYISDATGGGLANECYDVYPNPVRPGYEGPITVDGLMRDSEVKFTDITGNVVFQTISNGGRATWNGRDFNGDKVATGVYFALVADAEGNSTCVTKLLFVN